MANRPGKSAFLNWLFYFLEKKEVVATGWTRSSILRSGKKSTWKGGDYESLNIKVSEAEAGQSF